MSNLKKLILSKDEKLLGNWTIGCIPMQQGKFLGKLFVTDKTLYFEAQFDISLGGLLEQIAVSAVSAEGHSLLVSQEILKQWQDNGYFEIPKDQIKEVITKTSLLKKKVIILLSDDNEFVFDYGAMSIKKLVEAIKA